MPLQPLFDPSTLLAYAAASAVLVMAPGPGQALVITRSLQGGTRAGLLTAAGLEAGTLVHTFAAAFGLSAILTTSAAAFTVVKLAGAAYLVVLGVLALRSASRGGNATAPSGSVAPLPGRALFTHAAATGVLNPKVALFFLAFLPQFVRPERGAVLAQFLALGLLLSLLGLAWDSALSVVAGRARARFAASTAFAAWRERITGAVLIGLGLRLAFLERR